MPHGGETEVQGDSFSQGLKISAKDLKPGILVPELLTQICPGQAFCHTISWFQFVTRGTLKPGGVAGTMRSFSLVLMSLLGAACHGDLTEKLKLLYKMHVLPGKWPHRVAHGPVTLAWLGIFWCDLFNFFGMQNQSLVTKSKGNNTICIGS